MLSFRTSDLAAAVAALLLVALCRGVYRRHQGTQKKHLLPGPRPLSFIGNSHQIPSTYMQRRFTEWKAEYGDVVYIRLLKNPVVILNSVQEARDLLDKKSAIYSDRPRTVLYDEIMGWDSGLVFMKYGERWKKHRRWAQNAFNDKAALRSYLPLQQREVHTLLSGLRDTPGQFAEHIKRYFAALVIETAYGHTIASLDDFYVRMADKAVSATAETGAPGASLIDLFPFLRYVPSWLPGAGFMRRAIKIGQLVKATNHISYENVKNEMNEGTAKPCLVSSLIRDATVAGILTSEHEEDIKGVAGILYAAATDTSRSTLLSFFLAMVIYPDALKKAQGEIDRVVGRSRLPDFEDRDSLPYLECLVKEAYRWSCPLPLGIAHRVMEEDDYRGFYIPKGSTVIPNSSFTFNRCMTQDSTLYPEPEKFCPERFQDMTPGEAEQKDPSNFIFGFGRRICPGRHFADENIWLAIACTASLFNIQKARDIHGRKITPDAAFSSGFVSHPKRFECEIRPRSEDATKLLLGYFDTAL
ncbi:cytochrome P450 [Wolfiporia cocos MD-104 SS10]|uniref:Cytochrome P450 n=1 Tax=Wolfiporia cocos (strain MD-104) TaxID=742152 RepID=A0A2H3JHQ5_WOLCO|nr:cytochrome P450 [Wolfiporia cocos MD-104 SS10]